MRRATMFVLFTLHVSAEGRLWCRRAGKRQRGLSRASTQARNDGRAMSVRLWVGALVRARMGRMPGWQCPWAVWGLAAPFSPQAMAQAGLAAVWRMLRQMCGER